MKKKFTTLLLTTTIILSAIPSVMGKEVIQTKPIAVPISAAITSFTDLEQHAVKADIDYLVGRDIVRGYGDASFRPEAKLTNAEAMTLLTNAFELKVDATKSVSTTLANDNLWYSTAFSAALANEVTLEQAVAPNATVTREQFASWIVEQLDRIGPYPTVRMFINIADADQLTTGFEHAVQIMLLTRITALGEDGKFRPQDAITRAEAADWMADAVQFADRIKETQKATELELATTPILKDEFIANLKVALNASSTISDDDASTEVVTREQAATWIIEGLHKKGPFPVKMMLIHMADEADMKDEHKNNIHTLLLIDVAELDDEGKFNPKAELKMAEALAWLQNVEEFASRFE